VGQFEEALSHLSVAAEAFDELDELEGRARCDLEAANALTSLGQFEEAEELYRRTRAVFDALGHDSQVVLSDANRAVLLARTDRLQEAADLNSALLQRSAAAGVQWLVGDISNHLARNLIDLGRPAEALAVLDSQSGAGLETAARVQSRALRARALLATGRRAMAARAAEEGLRLAAGAEAEAAMVAERAELYEMRGQARLTSRSAPRVASAERDLAHAVALYLAAGLTDKARELSQRFLPGPGIGVHRGGFLTEQPTLPLPEPRTERGESRPSTGLPESRND
jgi:tetratricopeptide (TPR) repeat protein